MAGFNFFNVPDLPDLPPELKSAIQAGPGAVAGTADNMPQSNLLPAAFGLGAPARNATSVSPTPVASETPAPTGGSVADVDPMALLQQALQAQLAQRAAGPSGFFRRLFSSPEAEQARQKAWLAQKLFAGKLALEKAGGRGSTETDAQEALRKAQTGEADARTKKIIDEILHPEKYRTTASEKEGRLNAKDFTSEVDRQVKAAEDAEREKFGNMVVPYSELDHEARIGDVELANKDNYPNVKLRKNYQDARDMREWLETQLSKFSSKQIQAGLLKASQITISGKSIKLTPALKAKLIGYVDAKSRKLALTKSLPTTEPGQPEETLPAVESKKKFLGIF